MPFWRGGQRRGVGHDDASVAVSATMVLYFGVYFWSLATWKEVPDGVVCAP